MKQGKSGHTKGLSRPMVALLSAAPSLALGLYLGSSWQDENPPPHGPGMHQAPHRGPGMAQAPGSPPDTRLPAGQPMSGAGRSWGRAQAMAPSASAAGTARGPGAEGYGPLIRAAYDSGDADAAWDALQQLERCASAAERLRSVEQARSQPGSAATLIRQQIEELQAEMRRCQTITPELAALASELALRAMRARIPGAAAAYARATANQGTSSATRAEMLAALGSEAQQGQSAALQLLANGGAQLGVTPVDQRAYRLAQEALDPRALLTPGSEQALSAEDEARARASARRIIDKAIPGWR